MDNLNTCRCNGASAVWVCTGIIQKHWAIYSWRLKAWLFPFSDPFCLENCRVDSCRPLSSQVTSWLFVFVRMCMCMWVCQPAQPSPTSQELQHSFREGCYATLPVARLAVGSNAYPISIPVFMPLQTLSWPIRETLYPEGHAVPRGLNEPLCALPCRSLVHYSEYGIKNLSG